MRNKQHGGNRKGAGRPTADPLYKKVPSTVKLSQWITNRLNDHSSAKAVLIEEALIKVHGWKPPRLRRNLDLAVIYKKRN